MKFAKVVFWAAGAFGVLALAPLYFMFDLVGRLDPPPVTHPQFYYGFAGVGLAWQFAFFAIATDPARFRPMMIPALLEKLSYVGRFTCAVFTGPHFTRAGGHRRPGRAAGGALPGRVFEDCAI